MSLRTVGRRTSEVGRGVVESGVGSRVSSAENVGRRRSEAGRVVVESGVGSRESGAVNLASGVGRQTSDANKQWPAFPAQEVA